MAPEGQLHLPGFEDLAKLDLPKKRKFPRFERMGRSLDLPTLKSIRLRVEYLQKEGEFGLSEIFPTKEEIPQRWVERDEIHDYLELTRLYLYEYLPQGQVAIRLGWMEASGTGIPRILGRAIQRIIGRHYFGKGAIEALKPTQYLYERIKAAGLNRASDIIHLSERKPQDESEKDYPLLARVCTSRRVFNELVVLMHKRGFVEFNPKVAFISELPAEKVAKYFRA